MHLLQTLRAQWQILVAELAKFGVIGVVNTGLDFAIFNGLHFGAGVGPLTSKVVATAISATSSYFMNRHWTFRHRRRSGIRREYALFFLLNLVGLAIGLVCIGVTRYGLDRTGVAELNAANFVGLLLGTLFRFWSYRRWVFLADGRLAADEEPADEDPTDDAPAGGTRAGEPAPAPPTVLTRGR